MGTFTDDFTEASLTNLVDHPLTSSEAWEYVSASPADITCRAGLGFAVSETSAVKYCRIAAAAEAPAALFTGYVEFTRVADTGGTEFGIIFYKDNTRVADETNSVFVFANRISASLVDIRVHTVDTVPAILDNQLIEASVAWGNVIQRRLNISITGYEVTAWVSDAGTGLNPTPGGTVTIPSIAWAATADRMGAIIAGGGSDKNRFNVLNLTFGPAVPPETPDPAQSTLTALPTAILADGVTTSVITARMVDFAGDNITAGGNTILMITDKGTLGSVTDNGNGTYTATLTSAVTPGLATITATIDGDPMDDDATVQMTEISQEGIIPLNIVRNDSSAVGGAIDPDSDVRDYSPFPSAEQISFVSDKATDTRSVIVRGYGTDGEEIAEKVKLQGTTTVTTARFYLKVFMIETNQASDTLDNDDPAINAVITITSATLSDSVTPGRTRLTNMLAYVQPMDFGTIVRYEKLYFFNNSGSTISAGATLTITDGSDGSLEWGLDLAKNDVGAIADRNTAPVSVVFDVVATVTPVDLLANDFHGLWIKQTLTTKQRLTDTKFIFVNPLTNLDVGMEPLDRVYDQIVAL